MRDFFRSDPYIKYRGRLTGMIDSRTAQLVTTLDMSKIPTLQAEVRMLVYVRDELPKVMGAEMDQGLPSVEDLEDLYSAPEEEGIETSEEEAGEDHS